MPDTPVYSIIIPHYNIPDLLIRCLDSIPVREDVQVIVVDDNSPDADSYTELYPALSRPYLEFIHTPERKGAGFARNIGIQHARGKWLVFADADDFFVDDFNNILDEYKEAVEDIVYFRTKGVMSNDVCLPSSKIGQLDAIVVQYLNNKDENTLRCRHTVPWGKFIRASFIADNHFRFEEIPFSNDLIFCALAGCNAKSVSASSRFLYNYSERPDSISQSFAKSTEELVIRAKACARYHRIVFASPYSLNGRYPISDFLAYLFQQDRATFKDLFIELPQLGCSRRVALRQVCAWQRGLWKKLSVVIYCFYIVLWRV